MDRLLKQAMSGVVSLTLLEAKEVEPTNEKTPSCAAEKLLPINLKPLPSFFEDR